MARLSATEGWSQLLEELAQALQDQHSFDKDCVNALVSESCCVQDPPGPLNNSTSMSLSPSLSSLASHNTQTTCILSHRSASSCDSNNIAQYGSANSTSRRGPC